MHAKTAAGGHKVTACMHDMVSADAQAPPLVSHRGCERTATVPYIHVTRMLCNAYAEHHIFISSAEPRSTSPHLAGLGAGLVSGGLGAGLGAVGGVLGAGGQVIHLGGGGVHILLGLGGCGGGGRRRVGVRGVGA